MTVRGQVPRDPTPGTARAWLSAAVPGAFATRAASVGATINDVLLAE
jgi:hypothetical protein